MSGPCSGVRSAEEERLSEPYEIIIDEQRGIIRCIETGLITVDIRDRARREVAGICSERRMWRVLVDVSHATMLLPMLTAHEFATRFNSVGFPAGTVLAYLTRPNDQLGEFIANTINNWSYVRAETFNTEEEAIRFLLGH